MKCSKCGGEDGITACPVVPMPIDLPTYQLNCPCGMMWRDSIPIRRGGKSRYDKDDEKWVNVTFVRFGSGRKRASE
jgi:hypothetical protein